MKKLLLFILALPLLTLFVVGNATITQFEEMVIAERKLLMEKQIEDVINFLEPASFMQKIFEELAAKISNGELNEENIQQLIAEQSKIDVDLNLFVFSENKTFKVNSPALDDFPAGKFLRFLHNVNRVIPDDEVYKIKKILGSSFPVDGLASYSESIMEFSGNSGSGFLFYHSVASESGAIFITLNPPSPVQLAKLIPDELRINNLKVSVSSSQDLAKPYKSSEGSGKSVSVRKFFDRLEISASIEIRKSFFTSARFLFGFLIFLFGGCLSFLISNSYGERVFADLSIRSKVLGLAVYVVFFPLTGLGYLGYRLTNEHRALLKQNAVQSCINCLNKIEAGYDLELEKQLQFFRGLIKLFDGNYNKNDLSHYFLDLFRNGQIYWVDFRDINANLILSSKPMGTAEDAEPIIKAFSKYCIKRFSPNHIPASGKFQATASEIAIEEFFESKLGGWSRILESPDELNQISFGGFDLNWYWNVCSGEVASIAFVVCDQLQEQSAELYLKEVAKKQFAHENTLLRTFSWSQRTSRTIPDKKKLTGELAGFIYQIRRNRQPQFAEIYWEGKKWLAVGTPGKRLKGNVILALYPLDEIDRKLFRLRSNTLWAMAFAVFLAILSGRQFSYVLLNPIFELMKGVRAITRREVSQRVTVLQNDEFGKLSKKFNQTIETIADLVDAQKIQKLLIPQESPTVEGWQSKMVYRSAADLGGNYCDFLHLNDDSWLIAIGDVNGRGVSSSLVTAMVKAILFEFSGSENDLPKLLETLNGMLFQQFRGEKSMTLFAAVFNSSTGELSGVSAGHLPPVRIQNAEVSENFATHSKPLGISEKLTEPEIYRYSIQPDEGIVLYSNSLVATINEQNRTFGIERLKGLCRKCYNEKAEIIGQRIVQEVESFHQGQKIGEDITLLILKREAKSSGP